MIENLTFEDVQTFISKTTETEELKEKILQQVEKIASSLKHDILFLKQIVRIAIEGNTQLEDITTASDLFLTTILGKIKIRTENQDIQNFPVQRR